MELMVIKMLAHTRLLFTIELKRIFRHFAYLLYHFHRKHFAAKIPLYDFQTIDIIKTLPTNAVCLDIGVNEGQILYYIQKHCTHGKAIAVEPIPQLAYVLQKKYNKGNIDIKNYALFDQEAEMDFFYFPKRHALSGLHNRQLENQLQCKKIKVQSKRLDDVFTEDRLDFIKIDVEGAEYNILKGGLNILKKFRPIIVFESGFGGLEHYGYTAKDIFELLHTANYHLSNLQYYLDKKKPFSKEEFISNFEKGYDYQYIAFPIVE